jgi:ureidoglycolate hydrolase
MENIYVPVQKANLKNFAPYGRLLDVLECNKKVDYEDAESRYWYDVASNCNFGPFPNINYFLLKRIEPVATQLIKVATDEAYFNMGGGRLFYFIADHQPNGKPDLTTIKAFCFEGTSPLFRANVWRTPPYSADKENLILLVMDKNNVYFGENGMKRDPTRVIEYNLCNRYMVQSI